MKKLKDFMPLVIDIENTENKLRIENKKKRNDDIEFNDDIDFNSPLSKKLKLIVLLRVNLHLKLVNVIETIKIEIED